MTVSRYWGCGLKRQYLSPTLLILPSQGPRSRTARTRPPVRPTPQAPSFQRKENPMGYGHLLMFYVFAVNSLLKCLTRLFRRWFNRTTQRFTDDSNWSCIGFVYAHWRLSSSNTWIGFTDLDSCKIDSDSKILLCRCQRAKSVLEGANWKVNDY